VLESQDVPAAAGNRGAAAGGLARSLVARRWGLAVAGALNTNPPPAAGPPEKVLIFDYTNQRRGGEVVSGGVVAYWDGENVVPVSEINLGSTIPVLGTSQPQIVVPPLRPITAAHLAITRALHGRPAVCAVSDDRAQARLLRARESQAATISVVNRYQTDLQITITTHGPEKRAHLPLAGKLTLPAGQATLLPLDYELGPGVTVEQATLQLLDAHALSLSVTSAAGGEIVLQLPGPLIATTVDGGSATVSHHASSVRIAVSAGEHQIELKWRSSKRTPKHRTRRKGSRRRHHSR